MSQWRHKAEPQQQFQDHTSKSFSFQNGDFTCIFNPRVVTTHLPSDFNGEEVWSHFFFQNGGKGWGNYYLDSLPGEFRCVSTAS